MLRSWILVILLMVLFAKTFAQDSLDSLMFAYAGKFWNYEEIIFVQGNKTSEFGNELISIYNAWRDDPKINVKFEDEINTNDLKKHLTFFGPIKSYLHLNEYLPSVLTITKNGFKFGEYNFYDSLDAISLISSDGKRRFQLGNSIDGVKTLWTTFADISQYIIMQNYAVTHHGFLMNDEFDELNHYDLSLLRKKQLKKHETKYYLFYYDPAVFTSFQNFDSLFALEDVKLESVFNVLNFENPGRKIECYLYKDLRQKYYLSATPGGGNPFPAAFQNHSVGFSAVEHESIHVLMGNASTLFSEGIVGYYYSTVDCLEWKRNRSIVSQNSDFLIQDFITGKNGFDFSELAYAASGYFAKFLIDTYGLEKFKMISKYEDVHKGFEEVYDKSLDEIIAEWNIYHENTKIELGEEREVTFKVVAESLTDTSSIFITGTHSQLGTWDPHSIQLKKEDDGTWNRKFIFPEGTIIRYKFTRGSWDKEALDDKGNVPGNSVYEVMGDTTITTTINKWKDKK